MSARVVVLCALLVGGCEQLLGIHDPSAGDAVPDGHGSDAGMDGSGSGTNDCAVLPSWGAGSNYNASGGVAIAAGDVNQDGKVDVLVAVSNDILVFHGNGSGILDEPVTLRGTVSPATNLLIADVNGDGLNDVVAWTTGATDGVTVYLQLAGTGGSFSDPATFAVGEVIGQVLAADFDHNTSADLLVVTASDAQAFLAMGSGTFSQADTVTVGDPPIVAVSDLDGDGYDDILFPQEVSPNLQADVVYNDPTSPGKFGTPATIGPPGSYEGASDGHYSPANTGPGRDLLLCLSTGVCQLFAQTSPRTFMDTSETAAVLVGGGAVTTAIDINGDGRDDIVLGDIYAVQCTGSGAGTFDPSQMAQPALKLPPQGPGSVLVDINGDGKPDLLSLDANPSSFLQVMLQ